MPARRPIRSLALACVLLVAACGGPSPAPSGSVPGGSTGPDAGTPQPQSIDPAAGVPEEDVVLPAPEKGDVPAEATTPVVTGTLDVQAPGAPVTATVAAAGGTVEAGPLAITFPADALADGTAVSIQASPVSGAGGGAWGGAVRPVSDLFTVSGAETFDAVATVGIAVSRKAARAGEVLLLAYYDPATGRLDPLAPVDADPAAPGVVRGGATHFSAVVAVAVNPAKLPDTVDSGFRPGKDDWQFTNYGSYAASGGHCAGQVLSEMWYYAYQRKGAGASPLYGLYDNNGAPERTQTLWQDDSNGYRLASTAQEEPFSDEAARMASRKAGWANSRLAVIALRLAIATSGMPQYLSIGDKDGKSGHAIAAYRVTPDRIFVADPNYPGRLRTIRITGDGTLAPYSSGESATAIAAGKSVSYVRFAYIPAVATLADERLAALWAQFEAGTIGDTVFPATTVWVRETGADGKATWSVLKDGYTSPTETLTLSLDALSDGASATMRVFAGASETALAPWDPHQELTLTAGDNPLGIDIRGLRDGKWRYVNFIRLTVRFGDPAATPTPTPSAAGGDGEMPVVTSFTGPTTFAYKKGGTQKLTITMSGGTAPYHYTWSGRGTPLGEADGPATFTITLTDDQVSAASNGAGYYISVYITDANGVGARWVDATGRKSSEFIYAIEGLTGMPQQAVLYPPLPYRTPEP